MVDAEQFLSAHSSVTQSGGAGARAASRSLGVAMKPRSGIGAWRLARARARVTEMVDAEQFLSAHSSVTQSGGAGARAASRSLGVARPSPIHKK